MCSLGAFSGFPSGRSGRFSFRRFLRDRPHQLPDKLGVGRAVPLLAEAGAGAGTAKLTAQGLDHACRRVHGEPINGALELEVGDAALTIAIYSLEERRQAVHYAALERRVGGQRSFGAGQERAKNGRRPSSAVALRRGGRGGGGGCIDSGGGGGVIGLAGRHEAQHAEHHFERVDPARAVFGRVRHERQHLLAAAILSHRHVKARLVLADPGHQTGYGREADLAPGARGARHDDGAGGDVP
jgi:hypothetical protein